jgi:hypothetical protein
MSTIERVAPELRDALALWPLAPLTADKRQSRSASALPAWIASFVRSRADAEFDLAG